VAPTDKPNPPTGGSLGRSARRSLLWGGGYTFIRDVAQFGAMLILVRLLTAADYGVAALAQSIVGLAGIVSIVTFSAHTLHVRDPAEIDWQVQFTAATVLNLIVAAVVLMIAFGLSFTEKFREIALPLAVLSVVFLVEIPGALRHRMLETAHDWKRLRGLLLISTFLALGTGLLVAYLGGGVWALIVQVPMLGLPAAIDLLVIQRFRPDWSWGWPCWRETFCFGVDRIGAGFAGRGRVLTEQALLSSIYDLATLGIFGRATGLATLIAGRMGSVAMQSLTPVVTRAEAGSARFQRLADLVLRGVVWSTLPAAAFLGLAARDMVAFLYGAQWDSVATLLPLAALAIGVGGIISALSSLLVANDCSRASMSLDVSAGVSAILVAIALMPYGAFTYLAGLGAHALVVAAAASALLMRRGALSADGLATAFVPALLAVAAALAAAFALRRQMGGSGTLVVRLATDALAFGVVYLATLRLAFAQPLAELIEVAPGGARLGRILHLQRSILT
jgi:O-antigen/teichoic acid export membrane protein